MMTAKMKFASGLPFGPEDRLERTLADGLSDALTAMEQVRNRRQYRGRYGSELTPDLRRAMRRATAELDVEPDGKLPL